MKVSIKHQMIVMFVGLTVGILAMMFVLNACFLQPFYIHNKEKEFVKMYEDVQKGIMDGNSSLEEVAFDIND